MLRIRKNRILVELDKAADKTESGLLWLPDGDEKPPAQTGLVIAVGPEQFEVEVGQRIAFSRHSGIELHTTDRTRQIILDQSEVLGILTSDSDAKPQKRLSLAFSEAQLIEMIGEPGTVIVQTYFDHATRSFYVIADQYDSEVSNAS